MYLAPQKLTYLQNTGNYWKRPKLSQVAETSQKTTKIHYVLDILMSRPIKFTSMKSMKVLRKKIKNRFAILSDNGH